jgi:hypothetical protein
VATREPEGTSTTEDWASARLPGLAAKGSFRGVRRSSRPAKRSRAMPGVGGLRETHGGSSIGSLLRPPRPSTVTGPGPSRTSPGASQAGGKARHRLSLIFHLLRSVRTRAGPLAATPTRAEAPTGDRGPSSLGVRDLLPLHRHDFRASTPSAPSCPETPSGRRHHPSSSRSARVVSHHPDGFLRAEARGFVAPRCRS